MQIQTLEERTGLDRATIRFYEKEGLISPNRLQNGYRDYTDDQLVDLMRIKLLRQTGLSLEIIKQLIDGREVLSRVLSDQLKRIDEYEGSLIQARSLCKMMLRDNVEYHSIDPFRYIKTQEVPVDNQRIIDASSQEIRYTQAHPFRRFIARYLDQMFVSSLVVLVTVVFLRVRPYREIHNTLLSLISVFVCVPVNALCLWLFGTTPGKFATGISIRDLNDRNLTFFTAIKREWGVFRYGNGFFIPIYSIFQLIKSFRTHVNGQELSWDYVCDVKYKPWTIKRVISVTILSVFSLAIVAYCAFDIQYPRNRADLLTMEQYTSNYNNYVTQNEMQTYLSPEGEWYNKNSPNEVVIETDPAVEKWSFITDENEYLKAIEYELSTDTRFFFLDQRKISVAIFTAVISKTDARLSDASAALTDLSEIESAIASNITEGEFEHCGVVVKWESNRIQGTKRHFRLFITVLIQ